MSFLNNIKEKESPQHPWIRLIKKEYLNVIKYGHNSINNPIYPRFKNDEVPGKSPIKFTIIGNRVTEEFNYCVNLVKGLHKYRSKSFDNPVIKGVTTVEWPKIWNDLKIQYGGSAYCLNSQVAVLINDKFLGGEKELKDLIEMKYTYHFILDYYKEGVDQFSSYVNQSGRPCAYMHISINDEHIGTLIFMLYADLVPNTCENFLRLCQIKKGGYSGTPIHRIVKDSWIQCGGFGLKSVDLACENFIVPHDRRGVLCMANDGRHVDCSTQFFVLLQPAPWMACKYVAFGQLIDGKSTLEAIESVPTWYESPTSEIIMYETGILNLECEDIMINKGTNEYIQGHIEDLVALGEILYEELIEKVFLVADMRYRERLLKEEMGETLIEEEGIRNIRATQRFMRKKEDIDKQIQADNRPTSIGKLEKSKTDYHRPSSAKSQADNRRISSAISEQGQENNEFDVEVYEYEPEESSYKHISLGGMSSIIIKPERPYYIALTDVPYPGDVDSTFDLKKMLRGDYCLESDLFKQETITKVNAQHTSYISEMFRYDNSQDASNSSLGSEDELEIKKYLKHNVDRVSFAGSVVRAIARGMGKVNIFEDARKSELITDEESRRFRIASADRVARESTDKKVSIAEPFETKEHRKIKRRQTGIIRAEDLERLSITHKFISAQSVQEEEESATTVRKVRIAPSAIATQTGVKPHRKQTGIRPMVRLSDLDVNRQSALSRLYDDVDVTHEEEGPTLKDFKPLSEVQPKHMLLTYSPNSRIKSDESTRDKYLRHVSSDHSYEHALSFQHGKKVARKISSDYVKTIDQMQQKGESSIRSVEFAKTRPCLSVSEYQLKNQKYRGDNKSATRIVTVMPPSSTFAKKKSSGGLRLPGDTPLYSMVDIKDRK